MVQPAAPDVTDALDHEGEQHVTFKVNPLNNFPFTVTVQKDNLKFDKHVVIIFIEGEVGKPENKSISARDKRDIVEYLKLAKYYQQFPEEDILAVWRRLRLFAAVVQHSWPKK